MNLVIHPPVEPERLGRIAAAARPMAVGNAADEDHALGHMPDADAFFGKVTPRLLAAAPRLRWVQAPTASLEHTSSRNSRPTRACSPTCGGCSPTSSPTR